MKWTAVEHGMPIKQGKEFWIGELRGCKEVDRETGLTRFFLAKDAELRTIAALAGVSLPP